MFPSATEFRRPGLRAAIAGLALLGVLWIAACGGGGGGSSDTPVDPPPPPPPTGVSGHILYSSKAPDGTFIAPMDASSTPRMLTPDEGARAWPDGSQYFDYSLGTDGKTDILRVRSASNNSELYQISLPNFSADDLQASPISKTTFLSKYFASATDDIGLMFIADVSTGQLIYSEPVQYQIKKFRWLPDGRILRADTLSGEIAIGDTGGHWQVTGRIAIPTGYELREIEINPQGTQMALIIHEIDGGKSDAWIAQLDGSKLERISADQATYQIYWSPDGQRLLFDFNTAFCAGGSNCQGSCNLWHAPASARNLTGLYDRTKEQGGAMVVRERNTNGSIDPLITCSSVQGWLP